MAAALRAGIAYALVGFLLGMMLGPARLLVLEPALGSVPAVLIELPIILGASWLLCRALIRRSGMPATAAAALIMGVAAFTLVMTAEFALALWTPGTTGADYLARIRAPAPLFGLVGQILFAAFPLIQIASAVRANHGAAS